MPEIDPSRYTRSIKARRLRGAAALMEALEHIGAANATDGGGSHQVTWTAQSLSSLAMATVACQQVCGREIVKV